MQFRKTSQSFLLLPFILLVSIVASLSPERLGQNVTSRALAPLRRVVSRDVETFQYQRHNSKHPRLFVVIDSLDCGHKHVAHEWDFLDLINAYSSAPYVTARRHRCHDCRDLAAAKKPVQSVGVKAVAVTA
jgi:hypothetical protein